MDGFESRSHDRGAWAPPRMGVTVERRDLWELVSHGTLAGLLAGLGLGLAAVVASTVRRNDPWLPFDFAVAVVVGPEALAPTFPAAASLRWQPVSKAAAANRSGRTQTTLVA